MIVFVAMRCALCLPLPAVGDSDSGAKGLDLALRTEGRDRLADPLAEGDNVAV